MLNPSNPFYGTLNSQLDPTYDPSCTHQNQSRPAGSAVVECVRVYTQMAEPTPEVPGWHRMR